MPATLPPPIGPRVVPDRRRPGFAKPCRSCGCSDEMCLHGIYAGRRACCPRCANTDTHQVGEE